MKHNADVNLSLHRSLSDPERTSPEQPITPPQKILQRADCVWSRIELKEDEVLLVKVSLASADYVSQIAELVDRAFGRRRHQVLVFVDGTLDFTKVVKP